MSNGGQPEWVTTELMALLPEEPQAIYWSSGYVDQDIDRMRCDLLAVVASGLAGIRLEVVRDSFNGLRPAEYRVEAHWIGTSQVETLGEKYDLIRQTGQVDVRLHGEVEVRLKSELGPWGKDIRLPFSRDDYERDSKAAWQASQDFARALVGDLR